MLLRQVTWLSITLETFQNKNDGVWFNNRMGIYNDRFTPEQIQYGIDEVNRISKRMSEILADLGYDANKNSLMRIQNFYMRTLLIEKKLIRLY